MLHYFNYADTKGPLVWDICTNELQTNEYICHKEMESLISSCLFYDTMISLYHTSQQQLCLADTVATGRCLVISSVFTLSAHLCFIQFIAQSS